MTRTKIRIRADYLTRSSTSDHALVELRALAREVLETQTNHDERNLLIRMINRLTGCIGDRRERLRATGLAFGITSEDLLERILVAVSSSNVALFIEQLDLEATNMVIDADSLHQDVGVLDS